MRRLILIPAAIAALQAQIYRADDPVREWPAPQNAPSVKPRRINEYYDFFQNVMFRPGDLAEKAGAPIPARAVNTLGEVPNSEWYTNRHYARRMSKAELVRGPGNSTPPSIKGHWRVVSAKNEGITPGFTIVDSEGRRYLLKFDPPSNPEIASAADVIASKFFYALGYNVPENYIVRFRPGQLKIDGNTKFTDSYGRRRIMTERDFEDVIEKVTEGKDTELRALASRFIPGSPIGPFRYHGTRADDPNDTVPHEHRRDLRGLRVFAAWLGHDDSKSLNTLDTLVKENGIQYVRHYLIDFGSTLGSATYGANSPRSGSGYLFEWGPAAKQFATLGFAVPKWARAKYPKLPSVGAFEYELFDPKTWVPEYPNPAFSNITAEDAFWAAKQVMAFTDDEIREIVQTGEYTDNFAGEWVARCLIQRRNKIGRAFFSQVLPLDRFEVRNGRLTFEDLAAMPFGAQASYSVQWYTFDNVSGRKTAIPGATDWSVPATDTGWVAAEIRGAPAQHAIEVVIRDGSKIVGRQNLPAPILSSRQNHRG
jgi:hypothetical protein